MDSGSENFKNLGWEPDGKIGFGKQNNSRPNVPPPPVKNSGTENLPGQRKKMKIGERCSFGHIFLIPIVTKLTKNCFRIAKTLAMS